MRYWLLPLAAITMIGAGAGILADDGLPSGVAGPATVSLLVAAAALSAVALSKQDGDRWVVAPALVGVGLCGAGLDWWSDGGFAVGYVALVGLALRVPRRAALLAAIPVVGAIAVAEAHDAAAPASAVMSVLLGFGFLFTTSAFAAVSLEARRHAEEMLAREAALRAQETATTEARERAAALAERSRLARELHDVLAHSLAALAAQLESARLTAIYTEAGAGLVDQIGSAHRLTRIGMLNARRALQMLREEEAPGPACLPSLVSQSAAASGIPIAYRVEGTPRPLNHDAALAVYRTVQEALTNVAKHAGRGAQAVVRLIYAPAEVEVTVSDSGGDGVDSGLPASGFGLIAMAERAELLGGQLDVGRIEQGFTVRLRLPAQLDAQEHPDVSG
ncbi:MAG: sensor histidine kinase [Streptosporangiaceae bacterium]